MAYEKAVFALLRSDREDARRAKKFDEWLAEQSEPIQAACFHHLQVLREKCGLGENGAKSFLSKLTEFLSLPPDEQDLWVSHGEYVRAEFEWAFKGKVVVEEVPA